MENNNQQKAVEPTIKTYAVTGEYHGSIIQALSEEEAELIFKKYYNNEFIILTKDISNYNLINL